ncbi:unnamed protein product [Rotaria sp. Silwood1]|nr:unnamed protein product [Rotaria sp. Silwood1]CAF4879984.1 unnamed protein product [Rotaria sp. Silwood1]
MWLRVALALLIIEKCASISSPIQPMANYKYSIELEANIADLWWTIDDVRKEITFDLHIRTTGWIALGISPGGGMTGADIGVGWVDSRGRVYFQDRYASGFAQPMIDNTTNDWFAVQGRELNGWTAIQFKRLLDTCDSMDYPIKSGTNILIYAYGLVDPDESEISYHENRRGTRMIPLQSYSQPPSNDKFAELDYFELRLSNYIVPSNDTTYHCKIYKAPTSYATKRHAIAYKILIDNENSDLVHHLLMHECNPSFTFDDNNLPDGVCDEINDKIEPCSSSIATGWAVGGDHLIEFPEQAGYPVGLNSPNKYFMVQMHYDNPKQTSNRRDSSGIRFYLGNQLRQHDLGYLTFGTVSTLLGLAIPPKVEKFIVDSYCPSNATRNIPKSGITVLSSFPHTHLQGVSLWTKLIRNKTAVEYLFNAESYHFNYQFENRLAKPIQLYPGDEFATRCIYNTMNKNEGGERTRDEMCLHFVTYYPRMDDLSVCFTMNTVQSLQDIINSSAPFDYFAAKKWFLDLKWTPESSKQWQEYYNKAPRLSVFARAGQFETEPLDAVPKYQDFEPVQCQKQISTNNNAAFVYQKAFSFLSIFIVLILIV